MKEHENSEKVWGKQRKDFFPLCLFWSFVCFTQFLSVIWMVSTSYPSYPPRRWTMVLWKAHLCIFPPIWSSEFWELGWWEGQGWYPLISEQTESTMDSSAHNWWMTLPILLSQLSADPSTWLWALCSFSTHHSLNQVLIQENLEIRAGGVCWEGSWAWGEGERILGISSLDFCSSFTSTLLMCLSEAPCASSQAWPLLPSFPWYQVQSDTKREEKMTAIPGCLWLQLFLAFVIYVV